MLEIRRGVRDKKREIRRGVRDKRVVVKGLMQNVNSSSQHAISCN